MGDGDGPETTSNTDSSDHALSTILEEKEFVSSSPKESSSRRSSTQSSHSGDVIGPSSSLSNTTTEEPNIIRFNSADEKSTKIPFLDESISTVPLRPNTFDQANTNTTVDVRTDHPPSSTSPDISQDSQYHLKSWPSRIIRLFLVSLLVGALAISCLPIPEAKDDKRTNDILVFKANQSKQLEVKLVNVTRFILSMKLIELQKNLFMSKNDSLLFTMDLPSYVNCSARKITRSGDTRGTVSQNSYRMSCTSSPNIRTAELKINNKSNRKMGLYLLAEALEESWIRAIFPAVIILCVNLVLMMEASDLRPEVVLPFSAFLATILKDHLYKGEDMTLQPLPVDLSCGSLVDEVLQMSGLLIIVKCLVNSGVYSKVARAMVSVCQRRGLLLAVIFLVGSLLAALLNRVTTTIILVPLVISIADASNLVSSTILIITMTAINIGNTWTVIGNDVIGHLAPSLLWDHANGLSWRLIISGFISSLITSVVIIMGLPFFSHCCFKVIRSQSKHYYRAKEQYVGYGALLHQVPLLTHTSCDIKRNLENHRSVLKLDIESFRDHNNNIITDPTAESSGDEPLHERHLALVGISVLLLVVPLMQFAALYPFESYVASGITPGVIAFTGALCVLLLFKPKAIISYLEIKTIVIVIAYRVTMQALMSFPVSEYIEDMLKALDSSKGRLSSTGYLWTSAIITGFVGTESFASNLLNMDEGNSNSSSFEIILHKQILGATLAGNIFLYASLSNVIGCLLAEKHGILITPSKFMKFGLITTVVSLGVCNIFSAICPNF